MFCCRKYARFFSGIFISVSVIYSTLSVSNSQPEIKHMKIISSLLLFTFGAVAFAQKADSVITDGGKNSVYYSFNNGVQQEISNTDWDLAFTTKGFNASILINEAGGAALYRYSNNVSDWANVDTNGFAWSNLYNSLSTWTNGAFNNLNVFHPDYGWGLYTMGTHDINGSRIFILKTSGGKYKKILIEKMSAAGVFTVKTADVDGQNEKSFTLNKNASENAGRHYILYSIDTESAAVSEPLEKDWDLLFTKFIQPVQAGPQVLYYQVYGIKTNNGCQVAVRRGLPVSSNDTSTLTWTDSITAIGSDWKSFNRTTFVYEITPDEAFFVRTAAGEVWKIWFTAFEGGAKGGFFFNTEKIAGNTASVGTVNLPQLNYYPNPASDKLYIMNPGNGVAKVSLLSSSGQRVQSIELLAGEQTQWDVSACKSGIYFLEVSSESRIVYQKLLID